MDFLRLKTRVVAGATAGNITVTGINPGDQLVIVQRIDIVNASTLAEFRITAVNTINNTGGTSSAAGLLLVGWLKGDVGQTGYP